jgi:hypothetical protein
MTKKEMFILLRHEIRGELDALEERIETLEGRAAAGDDTANPDEYEAPHAESPGTASFNSVLRKSPPWFIPRLRESGVDTLKRLLSLREFLTAENVATLHGILKDEGYE